MEKMVIIRNRTTKAEHPVPAALWHEKKNTPEFRGVFELIRTVKEPPEVVALKAKNGATTRKKTRKPKGNGQN